MQHFLSYVLFSVHACAALWYGMVRCIVYVLVVGCTG